MEHAEVVAAGMSGDRAAFGALVEPHRWELRVHCYRMLGNYDDADDIVQEVFLRAWRHRTSYAARSTVRAWLYKIATNACLDFIKANRRKARDYRVPPLVEPTRPVDPPADVSWLQPVPDQALEPETRGSDPAAAAISRETVELAFLVAIQRLPARQRAVLILTDVLDWPVAEAAALLEISVAAVKSALQRARATLRQYLPRSRDDWAAPREPSARERTMLRRYVDAHERADLDALANLLAEDVRVTMPPYPLWLVGRDALVTLSRRALDPSSSSYLGQWRGVHTMANRQPAVAYYVERPDAPLTRELAGAYRAQVLDVLRVEDDRITEITSFDPGRFAAFGLPLVLT
jgi:RNA polymerase sigma-70 factor (ECF subfamily)